MNALIKLTKEEQQKRTCQNMDDFLEKQVQELKDFGGIEDTHLRYIEMLLEKTYWAGRSSVWEEGVF